MKEAIVAVRARQQELKKELLKINGVLTTLREYCDHDWENKGTGYHGSDKGVTDYECRICGAEKKS